MLSCSQEQFTSNSESISRFFVRHLCTRRISRPNQMRYSLFRQERSAVMIEEKVMHISVLRMSLEILGEEKVMFTGKGGSEVLVYGFSNCRKREAVIAAHLLDQVIA